MNPILKPVVAGLLLACGIELAGEAANGAVAHVGLTADAPQPAVRKFD